MSAEELAEGIAAGNFDDILDQLWMSGALHAEGNAFAGLQVGDNGKLRMRSARMTIALARSLGQFIWRLATISLGQDWYAKAVERGARIDSIDQDLRNIFFRADLAKQAEMRAFLLREDPVRYAWVKPSARPRKRGA